MSSSYLDALTAVKASVSIPIAVKLVPYFSSTGAMARALVEKGADRSCCSTASISRTSTSRRCSSDGP
jgi:dihydroorotate dehydrogenase